MSTGRSKKPDVPRRRIYLDYAATTPLDPRVKKVMEPFFAERFGNPSSIYVEGAAAKKAVEEARTKIARCLEAHPDEIVFTSGGTEANNLAIFGAVGNIVFTYDRRQILFLKGAHKGVHIVTTNIEHSSVLEPLLELERRGSAEVTYVPVERDGIVKPEKIIAAIRPETALVSVMYANNEIGTIQPIAKIGKAISNLRDGLESQIPNRKSQTNSRSEIPKIRTPIFHIDACQAPSYLNCLVNALGVDLLTLDAHKIYGPKGVGCLYVRRGTPLAPQLLGGGQERGLRSATENVPGIIGFAEALRIAAAERAKESARLEKLRNQLYLSILPARLRRSEVPAGGQDTEISKRAVPLVNGSIRRGERLPNNLNISFPEIDTEFLTLQLDSAGIACSTKSSCLKDERESYVVAALGPPPAAAWRTEARRNGSGERARNTLRFTLGRGTRGPDIIEAAEALRVILRGAR